jgi:hypothetical protein
MTRKYYVEKKMIRITRFCFIFTLISLLAIILPFMAGSVEAG